MKKLLAAVTAAFCLLPCFAKISFGTPDINDKNEIVYTVNYETTGSHSYSSAFYSMLKEGSKVQKQMISCYPEQMELLSLMDKKVLQIRNRYGTARYYTATDTVSWIKKVEDIPLNAGVTTPYAPSEDGKWICYIEKTGISSGRLILESVSTEKRIELGENILFDYNSVPVKWSPDGSILLYEKNGTVYFCSPDALYRNVEVEERFRRIGRGTISSVEWASEKALIYIDDYIVYKINSRELYTTGLYSGIIGQGTAIGRLPFQFIPAHDKFSVNPEATGLVLAQDKKNFTYFKTLVNSCDYMDILYSKPYTDSKASLADYSVFWDRKGEPVLWLEKLPYDSVKVHGSVFKLGATSKEILVIEDSGRPAISPDKGKVAFFAGNTVYVYDINTWERVAQLSGEKILGITWESYNSIFIGGECTIRRWNIIADRAEVITLSSAENIFWDNGTGIIAEGKNGKRYIFGSLTGKWAQTDNTNEYKPQAQNGKFRVYLGTTPNQLFENSLYVRTLTKKNVTKALYASTTKKALPKQKVALIFDAYDNADGLPKIISSLNRFNIPGTFFLNGEFIRRYPSQTKQIALNNFECASLFFTETNLTDNQFIMDADFISRGLGRNEDEFYQCTGKELSLYWHAPYYQSNQDIVEAGKDAGYEYINSMHLHSDNVTIEQIGEGKEYVSPAVLIDEYVSMVMSTGGGTIPVTVGISQGGRPEYLWDNIDLLINALLDANFELVSLSRL